ncbi:MAG: aminoglycoside phosphotransferase family protein [archaeon]|jgi:aminoglycoside phosphotransferase (APT) family kinase protein
MNKREISKLFKKALNLKVNRITDKSVGWDQEVKIVETENGKYVAKFPKEEREILFREKFGTEQYSKAGIPVPKIIYCDKKCIIEEFIEGTSLDKAKLNKEECKKIYFDLGRLMKRMQKIKSKGYGKILLSGKGRYKTQKKANTHLFKKRIKLLEKSAQFSPEEIKKIKKYYKKNAKKFSTGKARLLHYDLCSDNIIIKKNEIAAIIDFGDLFSGPPSCNFVTPYINHFEDHKFEQIRKGYGKINLEEIKFYAFFKLTRRIARHKTHPYKKRRFERFMKLYKEIVGF